MAEIQLPKREERVRRTLRIPAGLDVMVVKYAALTGMSVNDLYVFLAGEALKAAVRLETYDEPRKENEANPL